MKKRLSECPICGKGGCMEFDKAFYCFRYGKTYKKAKNREKKKKKTKKDKNIGQLYFFDRFQDAQFL